ncbi:hypothetical protein J6590_048280 [Homalodisca vitripennis]|nr:hypothetical protein J6590_048280 [Homalodisca vitripennis]
MRTRLQAVTSEAPIRPGNGGIIGSTLWTGEVLVSGVVGGGGVVMAERVASPQILSDQ